MITAVTARGRLLRGARQAAAYLGMTEDHIYRLAHARRIPHYNDGRLFFYSDELDAWLEQIKRPLAGARPSKHVRLPKVSLGEPQGIADLMPRTRRLGGSRS